MLLYLSFSTSACLLGLWLWLGTIRWPVRVAVVIAGIAVIEELDILATGDALASFTLVFPIGVIVLVWTVLDLLKIRLKLVPTPHMTGDGAMSVGSTRFYILDLLLWAMAAGLLLGVARSIKPEAVAAAWTVIQQIGVVIFVAPSCACLRVLWLRFGRCSATHN